MSPILKPRPASPPRRSHDDKKEGAKLSPWHLIGLGLVALIGTGILAAIDRSQERVALSQVSPRPAPTKSEAPIVRAPDAISSGAVETARAPVVPASLPAVAGPARTQLPASDPGRDNRSVLIPPAEAAGAKFPSARAPMLPFAFEAPAERTPPASEGPTSTASLTTPAPPARPPASSEPPVPLPTNGALKTSAAAPLECLPEGLRAVLADVASRFGPVTVVSTHRLTTVNHSAGSIREKLHHDCKAVDIRPDRGRIEEIKTYLRGRREIVGVESYRNGVIHMDVSGGIVTSTRAAPRAPTRRRAAEAAPVEEVQVAAPQPAPPPPTSPFTPVVPDRYR